MTLQDRLIDQLLCRAGGSAALAIAAVQALYRSCLHLARSPLDRPAQKMSR